MAKMRRGEVVFVLGMHRSGTSAITRGLEVLGVGLGDNLLKAVEGINDKGFFEDSALMEMNTDIMRLMSAEWHSLRPLDWSAPDADKLNRFERIGNNFLAHRVQNHPYFGMKDPRLCRTLPLWQKVMKGANRRGFGILSIRNPLNVARSLERRDRFARVKSYYLWLVHVVESLNNSAWMTRRVVVSYEAMMANPEAQLERMAECTGLKVRKSELDAYRDEFLDAGLQHFSSAEVDPEMPPLVTRTYELLSALGNDEASFDDPEVADAIASISQAVEELGPLLRHCDLLEQQTKAAGQVQLRPMRKEGNSGVGPNNDVEKVLNWAPTWLAQRSLSVGEKALLNEAAHGARQLPSIGIVIVGDDSNKARFTLRSLGKALPEGCDYRVSAAVEESDDVDLNIDGQRLVSVSGGEKNLSERLNGFCRSEQVDWVLTVEEGVEFTENGLKRLLLELTEVAGVSGVFADELIGAPDGTVGSIFRPDFNLDLLLSRPATMDRHWLFNRESILSLGGFDESLDQACELALILKIVETEGLSTIGHAPVPLLTGVEPKAKHEQEKPVLEAHLHTRGYEANVQQMPDGGWRINYGHSGMPLLSVVVLSGTDLPRVQRCIETLLEKTFYKNYEIVLVDQGLTTEAGRQWVEGLRSLGGERIKVFTVDQGVSESSAVNVGWRAANGDYVAVVAGGMAITQADWVEWLLNNVQRPEVGVVGAQSVTAEGQIWEGPMVLGLNGVGESSAVGAELAEPGYMGRLKADQNVSAVGETGWMVERNVLEALGGLDETICSLRHAVVDLCLKAQQSGRINVWTPHSAFLVSAPSDNKAPSDDEGLSAADDVLYDRWLPQIAEDPSYNRNLALHGAGFEVELDIQRSRYAVDTPRDLPKVFARNADAWGCGHYRVLKPFDAMAREEQIAGWRTMAVPSVAEVARLAPDAVVLQRPASTDGIKHLRRMKQFGNSALVYELDDYLPNLPMKSVYRENMPKDILKSMRQGLQWTDRFVVSTNGLAEACEGLHSDIRVVENRLPLEWWGDAAKTSRQLWKSDKPRVGWAGGAGHRGDLELIIDVVTALRDEVHWVFLGNCPDKLIALIHEHQLPVPIDQYPDKLNNLDLDIALAPLEDNLFNRCKSNLRLLEYGACGYPVICSNAAPYTEHKLPVTCVRNRFKDWVDAIRDHIQNPQATSDKASQLQRTVRERWMLTGENLAEWRDAWTRF